MQLLFISNDSIKRQSHFGKPKTSIVPTSMKVLTHLKPNLSTFQIIFYSIVEHFPFPSSYLRSAIDTILFPVERMFHVAAMECYLIIKYARFEMRQRKKRAVKVIFILLQLKDIAKSFLLLSTADTEKDFEWNSTEYGSRSMTIFPKADSLKFLFPLRSIYFSHSGDSIGMHHRLLSHGTKERAVASIDWPMRNWKHSPHKALFKHSPLRCQLRQEFQSQIPESAAIGMQA